MKKITLESIRTIMVGLILSLGIGIAFAWTGPSVAPTGGNVAAPLNVSSAPQVKQGNLWLSGLDASNNPYTNGLIVQNGNVGIGTTSPTAKLSVAGDAYAFGYMTSGSGIIAPRIYTPKLYADRLDAVYVGAPELVGGGVTATGWGMHTSYLTSGSITTDGIKFTTQLVTATWSSGYNGGKPALFIDCPSGTQVISGGCDGGLSSSVLGTSPTSNGWVCVFSGPSLNLPLKGSALCTNYY